MYFLHNLGSRTTYHHPWMCALRRINPWVLHTKLWDLGNTQKVAGSKVYGAYFELSRIAKACI